MTKKSLGKILIIEDETMLQEALVEILETEGYSVRGCVCADDAFALIEEDKPDLILTDLVLPNIDGFGILRTLNEQVHLKDIPVVVLSNLGEDEDIDKAKALGALDFLIKAETPLDKVVKKVKKILE